MQSINLEAKKLKTRGIDIIIVLSHCGVRSDKIIARDSPDVDVVVGGHNHLLFYNGKYSVEYLRHLDRKFVIIVMVM